MRVLRFGTELKRFGRNWMTRAALVVAVLIPLLYGALYLWAFWNPTSHTDRLPVAIVNLDAGALTPEGTKVTAGDDVTAKLTATDTLDWHVTSPADARQGLEDGTFHAVLTIPAGFSQAVVTAGTTAPTKAPLQVTYNDANGFTARTIVSSVLREVRTSVSDSLGEGMVNQLLVGVGDIHAGVVKASRGADEVASGASKVDAGANQLATGTGQLATGADELATAAGKADAGASQWAAGATTLAQAAREADAGIQKLDAGAGKVATGTHEFATGLDQASTGANTLSTGASRVATGAQELAQGLPAAQRGAGQLATGADQVATGASKLATGAGQVDTGAQQLATGLGHLSEQTQGLPASTAELATGAQQVATGLNRLSTAAASSTDVATALGQLAAALQAAGVPKTDPVWQRLAALKTTLQTQQTQTTAALGQLATGADQVATGAQQVADGMPALTQGIDAAHTGAQQVATGASQVSTGASQVSTGATQVATGASELSTQLGTAATGAQQVATGAAQVATGTNELATKLGTAARGASQVDAGAQQVATGLDNLASQSPQLATGASSLATKTGELDAGLTQLAQGTTTLATAAHQVDTGARNLHTGTSDLAGGASSLSRGLQDAVKQIPTYDQTQRTQNAEMMSSPVTLDTSFAHRAEGNGEGFAPYFLGLAFYVGALILWMLLRPISQRSLAAPVSATRVVLSNLLPALVIGSLQVLVLVGVLVAGLGLDANHLVAMLLFALLVSFTFIALQQMINIWLGTSVGRLVVLVLLMLQLTSASGTYPVSTSPGFFQAIHRVLPMTWVVGGFREAITGDLSRVFWHASVMLLFVLGGSLVLAVAGAVRNRTWTMTRLHPAVSL